MLFLQINELLNLLNMLFQHLKSPFQRHSLQFRKYNQSFWQMKTPLWLEFCHRFATACQVCETLIIAFKNSNYIVKRGYNLLKRVSCVLYDISCETWQWSWFSNAHEFFNDNKKLYINVCVVNQMQGWCPIQ